VNWLHQHDCLTQKKKQTGNKTRMSDKHKKELSHVLRNLPVDPPELLRLDAPATELAVGDGDDS